VDGGSGLCLCLVFDLLPFLLLASCCVLSLGSSREMEEDVFIRRPKKGEEKERQ
jgi:hypothetical protein